MTIAQRLIAPLACVAILAVSFALPARAQEKPCAECHAAIVQKTVAHKNCAGCHVGLDASVTPHKSPGKSAKQLAEEGPALCLTCHDKKLFEGKVAHAPVQAGLCLFCHNPHSSDYQGLLKLDKALLCLDCHPEIKKGPHVIAGFSSSGHPLGDVARRTDEKGNPQFAEDPLRPGKKFYCASCHEPHRSEFQKLTRSPARGMEICQKCHKK